MRIIVSVIVYNRFENLQRWLDCWKQCDQTNAELIVIHTGDEVERYKEACGDVKYIHRQNIGFDVGSFQDVCNERLKGFPNDWDYIIWCTDDVLPMSKDFVKPFIDKLQEPNVGLSCMQISRSKPGGVWHVRTTNFCISKQMSKRIKFPVDPVKTKQDCYLFEHRGGKNILSQQIQEMGLDCVQVAPIVSSPLWDTGFWKRPDRQKEHDKIFGIKKKIGNKVTFICTIYNTYPQIISSLLLQTHENWELILINDGPSNNGMLTYIPNDPRIKYIETKERKGNFGHYWRQWALNEIRERRLSDPDFIVITNADNYHVPVYCEYLLKGFEQSHTAVATFCDQMAHSYRSWNVIKCRLERGHIDCACVMVKREIACEVGWREIKNHSADWVYFEDIAKRYHNSSFIPVQGCLLVHN